MRMLEISTLTMKKLLGILALFPLCLLAQKRILLYPKADSMIYIIDAKNNLKVKPGDTLVIMNNLKFVKGVKLQVLCGTKDSPIVVMQENPAKAIGGYGGYAFAVNRAAWVTFTNLFIDGLGKSNSGFAIDRFQHITLQNFVIQNTYAFGIGIKTDYNPLDSINTVYPNINTDITVQYGRIQNTGAEGMYGGTSHVVRASGAIEVPIIGFTAHDLEFIHTGWDAAQWSNTQELKAWNITISDYGYKNTIYQKNGLVIGSSVTLAAPMENITINKGTGAALIVLGKGLLPFKKLRIKGVSASGESGIYLDDYDSPFDLPAQQVVFDSVRVDSVAFAPLYNANRSGTALPLKVHNYLFTVFAAPVYDATKGTFLNDVISPPPPVDDTLRISTNYTVLTNPKLQKLKWTNFAAGGKLTLPTALAGKGMTLYVLNPTTKTITTNRYLYYTASKYQKNLYKGYYKAWSDGKKWWLLKY